MSLARYLSKLGAWLTSDGKVPAAALASGAARENFGAGAVLQVVQAFKSDTWSSASASWTDVTGLSATITPSSVNSKIYVAVYLGRVSNIGTSWYSNAWRFVRNGIAIGVADAAGIRPSAGMNIMHNDSYYDGNGSMFYLDSPNTTSAVTYKVQTAGHGSGTVLLNRNEPDDNGGNGYQSRTASSLILMEIAG